jgi:hypothetical protein
MNAKRKNSWAGIVTCLITGLVFYSMNHVRQTSSGYSFTVMFYNVENLFDTQNDTLKDDDTFLPTGINRWTFTRYNKKVNDLAKVILASNGWEPPQLIGLCEIENTAVLSRLIWETGLSELSYCPIHHESSDRRGIDVALLYRSDCFKPIWHHTVIVSQPEINFFTRDILYVKGLMYEKDTLHLLVCHWPSKWGGELHSKWKRQKAAQKTKQICDSIMHVNAKAQIIIMGDLNETRDESSIVDVLLTPLSALTVLNPVNLPKGVYGTHKYQGKWHFIDHIIISQALESQTSQPVSFTIPDLTFLLEEDPAYSGMRPRRTYIGPRYVGGFSDHLPILATFNKKGGEP